MRSWKNSILYQEGDKYGRGVIEYLRKKNFYRRDERKIEMERWRQSIFCLDVRINRGASLWIWRPVYYWLLGLRATVSIFY
jgi:hypothetical protein